MKLTILCDNSVQARPGLIGEHGFACHIVTNNKNYLFDTGNGLGLRGNAATLGIDLQRLDGVLLSHGHWDHCGGLLPLLRLRGGRPLPVYAHPALFNRRVSRREGKEEEIGAGFSREEAETLGAVFHLSDAPRHLDGGLLFSGTIPRPFASAPDKELYSCQGEMLIPDQHPDDQSLYLQTDRGLTILCGCAHAGLRNIIAHAQTLNQTLPVHGLIGGLHLMFAENEQQDHILRDIEQLNLKFLALSHCTGARAGALLMQHFPTTLQAVVGSSFEI